MGLIYRQSLKGSAATFLGAGIGFVVTFFVLTKYLSPDEVGFVRLIIDVAVLLASFALLSAQTSIVRYYPYFRTEDGSDRGFQRVAYLLPLVGFFLFALLFLLFRQPLVEYFSGGTAGKPGAELFRKYYWLVLPVMGFDMMMTTGEVSSSVHGRVAVPKFIREVILRVLLGSSYLLFGLGVLSPFSALLGAVVAAYGICALLGFGYLFRLAPKSFLSPIELPEKRIRRDFLAYSSLTLLSALGSNVATHLDLFMVTAGMGFDYGGIFAIAFLLTAAVEMPSRSLNAIAAPFVSAHIRDGEMSRLREIYHRVSRQQLLIGSLIFLLIWYNIDLIYRIIPNGEIYSRGKWVFLILGLGKLIDLAFSFGNAIIRYSKYYVWSLAYTFAVTISSLFLNSLLIPRLGMEGAAVATLLTFCLTYLFQQIVIWRKMRLTPLHKELIVLFLSLAAAVALELGVLGTAFPPRGLLPILLKNLILLSVVAVLYGPGSAFRELLTKTLSFLKNQ